MLHSNGTADRRRLASNHPGDVRDLSDYGEDMI